MRKQLWIGVLAAAAVALAGAAPALAQSNGDGPRTPWGAPDLTGVWDFRTLTPIERPDGLGDKAVLTAEEAAAFEQQALRAVGRRPARRRRPGIRPGQRHRARLQRLLVGLRQQHR